MDSIKALFTSLTVEEAIALNKAAEETCSFEYTSQAEGAITE